MDVTYAELMGSYPNHLHVFTYGSKTTDATRYAIFVKDRNVTISHKCQGALSSFSVESYAILSALHWFESNNVGQAVVLSDCLSALDCIANYRTDEPFIVNQIVIVLNRLTKEGKAITLSWIPGHAGIPGNEVADRLAKEATSSHRAITIHDTPIHQ